MINALFTAFALIAAGQGAAPGAGSGAAMEQARSGDTIRPADPARPRGRKPRDPRA